MDMLAVGAKTDRTDVALEMRKLLPDTSIAAIRGALAEGEPFFEMMFGDSDHEENEKKIKAIVAKLSELGVEPLIWEYGAMEQFSDGEIVTPQYMENVFKRWVEIGDQFDELEKKGHRP